MPAEATVIVLIMACGGGVVQPLPNVAQTKEAAVTLTLGCVNKH